MTDFDAFAAAYRTAKRQRTFEVREHEAAIPATNPMDSTMLLFENSSRRGHSGVGGELRLDVSGSLNPTEAAVLHAMAEAVKLSQSKTVVRVAGGWVRDKLLGLENEDMDIAVDNCTGFAFAELINVYFKSLGQAVAKVAVIEANPEQSKHLETARMKIAGVWVDLVNLRTEVYRSDSRIPDTMFGTAEEDAFRRDFTLNALFYNVNEGKVEDLTGSGVDDLRKGIIRTPLPPMVTFRDDPLRVLRAVRFAARFGFTLDEELRAAARDSKTQAALATKVSRERVGAELSGMLTGKMAQPGLAMSLFEELGLAPIIFAPPERLVPLPPAEGYDWARGAAVARAVARMLEFRLGVTNSQRVAETEWSKMHERGHAEAKMGAGELANAAAGVEVGASEAAPSAAASGEGADGGGDTQVGGKGKGKRKEKAVTEEGNAGEMKAARAGGAVDQKKGGGDPSMLVRELFLCAALLPLAGVKHEVKKGKLVPAAQTVVLESLKLRGKEAKNVGEVLELFPTFRSLADSCLAASNAGGVPPPRDAANGNGGGAGFSRLAVGLAVREARDLWPTCVDLCCAVEMCESQDLPSLPTGANGNDVVYCQGRAEGDGAGDKASGKKRERLDAGSEEAKRGGGSGAEALVMEKYAGFRQAVASMGLGRAWEMAPLLRGNELMTELQVAKGPLVGKLMAKQASWQLEHPEGGREECIAFLKAALS